MTARRLRSGELLALAGSVVSTVGSFLSWYELGGANPSAWDRFGVVTVLVVIAAALGLWLAVSNLRERSPAVPVASAVWATLWGLVATIAVASVVLSHLSSLCPGSWVSLIGVAAVLGGAWQSLRDERTERYNPAQPPAQPPPV